ncbi:protein phosphatase 2C domain-containing protein [Streptomyces sp. NA04227]|uniref:protein phosphatase 2C domain-containing protein n=1 Tax=Streptomyces sp. NA04227 TaxID=2742136 RepID=UPI00158FF30A|nr:protein phosphatase 2C domain-containing protein [Streptomyces sp. NA04227]QKW09110.1 protein phosphatase 2C domain-containing protein [Streptomyces sp. NA04227]
MRIELATRPGEAARPNEDYLSIAVPASGLGGTLVLLDGVTPPKGDYGCVHSVPWFTARLGGALGELSVSRRDLTLTQILAKAIRRTADSHSQTCDLSHSRTPQATVVLARWDDTHLELLVLSDSALLVEHPDGAVTAYLDDRIGRLPHGSLASAARVDADLRNKEGGFFTAAADPSVADRAVTAVLPRAEVSALAALTDGATRWVEKFREGNWRDCFALIRKEGGEALIDRVRALELADIEERIFLRHGKTHDDVAVGFVEF